MKADILIIEDDRDLADSLSDILSINEYKVTIYHTGKQGLAAALENHPDLIILDIKLPDMNGYQVYEKLQLDTWGKTAKIMVLTASESLDNISKNINLSREYVLFKPEVSVEELRNAIAKRLAE